MTKLKARREAAGLSQTALAALSGVPLRAIISYDQGTRKLSNAAASTVQRLCSALRCTLDDIMEDDGDES